MLLRIYFYDSGLNSPQTPKPIGKSRPGNFVLASLGFPQVVSLGSIANHSDRFEIKAQSQVVEWRDISTAFHHKSRSLDALG